MHQIILLAINLVVNGGSDTVTTTAPATTTIVEITSTTTIITDAITSLTIADTTSTLPPPTFLPTTSTSSPECHSTGWDSVLSVIVQLIKFIFSTRWSWFVFGW